MATSTLVSTTCPERAVQPSAKRHQAVLTCKHGLQAVLRFTAQQHDSRADGREKAAGAL